MSISDESRRNKVAKQIAALEELYRSAKSLRTPVGEAEAEAVALKIASLQTKHSISEEMIRQAKLAKGDGSAPTPIEKRFYIEGTAYRKSRAALANTVAHTMDIMTRVATNGSYVIFFGFSEDVEKAWKLFQLIEPQMLAMADRRIKAGEHKADGLNGKSWKINYFEGFRGRVYARLRDARVEAAEEVVLADGFTENVKQEDGTMKEIITGRVTGALVLVDRKNAVEKFYETLHPVKKNKDGSESKRQPKVWQGAQTSRSSREARQRGRSDAQRARIRHDSEVSNARRPALVG